ncbi:MAG: cell division protein ZapE [Woeseia sp.]
MLIRDCYRKKVQRLGLSQDAAQLRIVEAMQHLQERISAHATPIRRTLQALRIAAPKRTRGLYLWGGVGRGKTFLMDLFFETLPIDKKRRIHFHRMMSEVHRRFRDCKDLQDPLDKVAGDIAATAEVLCIDEFYVSDIGDAMLLGRLMRGLFHRGVVLMTTSNTAPRDLYLGGLQRERFLPAIDLLEEHMQVLHMGGTTDYRLRLLQRAGTFLCPAGPEADAKLDRYFRDIASGHVEQNGSLSVLGREIPTRQLSDGIAWFDFDALCNGPRSQQDYIEIARWYPTVIVSNVPALTREDHNAVRRFIALVDEFYDRRVKLVLSADVAVPALYRDEPLTFEFERTTSRLTDMQTQDYLQLKHLP